MCEREREREREREMEREREKVVEQEKQMHEDVKEGTCQYMIRFTIS